MAKKLIEVRCDCDKTRLKPSNRWIANVEEGANLETQCPSCKECVTIKNGKFHSATLNLLKSSKK